MQQEIAVTILMATYNGALYLVQQLESILEQSHKSWNLVIRDDNSTDDTLKIIEAYVSRDSRITRIDYGSAHGSACKNFSELISWAEENTTDYIMFADQDDLWKPDKIKVSLNAVQTLENEFGKNTPALCYSAFQFINESGETLPQKLILPSLLEVRVLLNENHAWGCTMMLNQAALKVICPVPFHVVNHDYWIALVIAAMGKTRLITQDLILYRQHTLNVSGNVDNMSFTQRFNRYVVNPDYMIGPLTANLITVKLFYERYQSALPASVRSLVKRFLTAYKKNTTGLLTVMLKNRIFKIGFVKTTVYFYTLLLLRKKVIARAELNADK